MIVLLNLIKYNSQQNFVLLQVHVIWCVLATSIIYQLGSIADDFPLIIFSFHVVFVAINIVLWFATNWFENDTYLSSHCFLLFLKIFSFIYFAGVLYISISGFMENRYFICYSQILNILALWLSWRAISGANITTKKVIRRKNDALLIANDLNAHQNVNNVDKSLVIAEFSVSNESKADQSLALKIEPNIDSNDHTRGSRMWEFIYSAIDNCLSRFAFIGEIKQNIENKLLLKYNVNSQTIIAILNATVSIVGTICVLAWSTTQHYGTNPPTPSPTPRKYAKINGCMETNYKWSHSYNEYTQNVTRLTAGCTISTVAISMGILIIFVIAFGFFLPKCIKSRHWECCSTQSKYYKCCKRYCCDCNVCCWNLMDHHMRGTIIVKFIYFMLKPVLIYATQTTSMVHTTSSYRIVSDVFNLLYQILMFCTVSALAYITFSKQYLLIDKMSNIMHNAPLFRKTYIASYSLSIVATYSILIFVCMFTWSGDEGITKFQWYLVIYPQCGWLLFIKLYHNEISMLTEVLEAKKKKNKGELCVEWKFYCYTDWQTASISSLELQVNVADHDDNSLSQQILQYYKRLFLYQCSVLLAALYAVVGYLCLLCGGYDLAVNHSSGWVWQWMYIWQLIIALAVVVVMPWSIRTAWNKQINKCRA